MATQSKATSLVVAPSTYAPDAPPIFAGRMMDGVTLGVLRREFSGRTNSAADFGWKKLHPVLPATSSAPGMSWQPSCYRHESLLPATASDLLMEPQHLLQLYERAVLPQQPGLLLSLKLTMLEDGSLHAFWERARSLAHSEFVERRGLPVLMVMHVPSLSPAKVPARTHIHVLALARKLGPHGFGALGEFNGEAGRDGLIEAWLATAE